MLGYLILLFTILPAVELAVLIKVGTYIGVGNTLFLILLTGVSGAALARLQGFAVLQNIQISLEEGRMPTEEMLDGVLILVGGILLLTPGFITDTLGFLLLIPFTRRLIKAVLREKFRTMTSSTGDFTDRPSPRPPEDYEDADYY